MANLRAIVSNDRPIREENYPRTWFLYKENDIIEIHVRHDSHNRNAFAIAIRRRDRG